MGKRAAIFGDPRNNTLGINLSDKELVWAKHLANKAGLRPSRWAYQLVRERIMEEARSLAAG